jgi:hypothetical protein
LEAGADREHLHKVHGITAVDWDGGRRRPAILAAAFEGILCFRRAPKGGWSFDVLSKGDPNAPGSSEVKVFRLPGGKRGLATIDPFHGDSVAVYLAHRGWERRVILEGYRVGHSVVPVDFSGSGVDSLVLGFRGEKGKGGHAVVVMHPLDETASGGPRT